MVSIFGPTNNELVGPAFLSKRLLLDVKTLEIVQRYLGDILNEQLSDWIVLPA